MAAGSLINVPLRHEVPGLESCVQELGSALSAADQTGAGFWIAARLHGGFAGPWESSRKVFGPRHQIGWVPTTHFH